MEANVKPSLSSTLKLTLGFGRSWDEWVPEARVLKHNAENLKRQSELLDTLQAKKSKASDKKIAPGTVEKGKKRTRDGNELEEDFLKRPEVKIPISEALKMALVDDWENITKNQKLVSLPRDPNVSDILRGFKEYFLKENAGKEIANEDYVQEIVEGLKVYFEKALGNLLLYRFERQQYVEVKKSFPDKSVADFYGAEHLLRLFGPLDIPVQLPQLIAHTNMDAEAIAVCRDYFIEIIRYVELNSAALLTQNYENATPNYIQVSKAT
ncbi:Esa1p-associated factor [Dinochytrium kinnereticum]|nr:Esa1p-associated factor [Dinochytrium kinnereticum]